MYSEHLWALQAEIVKLGREYVEAVESCEDGAEMPAFGRLYGIGLTLKVTNEWNKHWEVYFANATRDSIHGFDILENFDFLND